MASEAGDVVNLIEALKFLGPIAGAASVTAIAAFYFGSRRPAPEKDTGEGTKGTTLGIQALLADHLAMQAFTAQIKRLADAVEDLARVGGRLADMMDIARAVERLTHGNKE